MCVKKVFFLFLVLMLGLSLCACGGISGEKAAEMYPDIIGQWGTDPFGETFVLTLSKDGSCVILDNAGTWVLESKESNSEYVTLSVKTENLKYYVRLNRVQEDRHYMFHSVELLIMDAKREIQIYEDYVFTQGNDFVSPEMAVQTVPELMGEWGSPYWAEESILTIREDGTCTVMRQTGKWCLWRDFSAWPKVVILMKLENGQLYESEFSMETEMDWGYTRAFLDIYDRSVDRFVWTDPKTGAAVAEVVNRNQVIHPLEVAAIAVGEWAESENNKNFATFREDGTCNIRGADGVWSLDYTAYYREKFRNGWDYCLRAKINGDSYDICFSDHGSGKYTMYIINQDDGIYILDASEVIKTNE